MAAKSKGDKAGSSEGQKGIYVYGILPADVQMTADMPGVGDPPSQVRLVRGDGIAALVSEVDVSRPLGTPEDLRAHEEILDASAADVPVLPLRFGAVLASDKAVAEELLEAHHGEFTDALDELDGRAEYVVKGRYVEQAILEEVLAENREAARLARKIRGADPDASRDARIQLGEIINDEITARREKDTRVLGDMMSEHAVASLVRDPTHEQDAVHVAFLVETGSEEEIEQTLDELAEKWDGRVELRLLGPMAAYDFVATTEPER